MAIYYKTIFYNQCGQVIKLNATTLHISLVLLFISLYKGKFFNIIYKDFLFFLNKL